MIIAWRNDVRSDGLAGQEREPGEIDTSVAHVARVYDYLLGGRANFAVDRAAAERAYAAWPGGLDGVRADARAHRAVLGRIVRYLTREAGIRQFLDIGTGIPKEDAVHEVAQREAPETRVVYVDWDPMSTLAYSVTLVTPAHGESSSPQTTARPPEPAGWPGGSALSRYACCARFQPGLAERGCDDQVAR